MQNKLIICVICVMLVLLPAISVAAPNIKWADIKTLKCTFIKGVSFDGKSVETTSTPFGKDSTLIIDSIDLNKKTVRAVGNAGGDDASILEASDESGMLTMVDRTDSGNWIFDTVFKDDKGNLYITSSRHVALFGQPIFSQSYGTCKIWN